MSKKVILSRKGFDSAYGGGASPIMPNGELISLPIPEIKNKGIKYTSLMYDNKANYQSLIDALYSKSIPQKCHLDPDIRTNILKKRQANWKGAFGQNSAAQKHLVNNDVGGDDIFLFFGSFRRTTSINGTIRFERDYERHIIYGFLKSDKPILGREILNHPEFEGHPHFENAKLDGPKQDYRFNAIYPAKNKSSYGTFYYHDDLVLTRRGFPKSLWSLPDCFENAKISRMPKYEEKRMFYNDEKGRKRIFVQSTGIGQDFVIDSSDVYKWAEELILNHKMKS